MFTLDDVKIAIGARAHTEHAYLFVTKTGEVGTAPMDSEEDPTQNQELIAGYFNSFHVGEVMLNPDAIENKAFVKHCYCLLLFAYHKFLNTSKVCWVGAELSDALQKKPVDEIIFELCGKIRALETQADD